MLNMYFYLNVIFEHLNAYKTHCESLKVGCKICNTQRKNNNHLNMDGNWKKVQYYSRKTNLKIMYIFVIVKCIKIYLLMSANIKK